MIQCQHTVKLILVLLKVVLFIMCNLQYFCSYNSWFYDHKNIMIILIRPILIPCLFICLLVHIYTSISDVNPCPCPCP